MACAETLRKVKGIVQSDPARRYLVVSAPGKRFGGEEKVTDLLYAAHRSLEQKGDLGEAFEKIKIRIKGVSDELNLQKSLDTDALLFETEREIKEKKSEAFTVSRGEYLSAKLMAAYINAEFWDAKELFVFRGSGALDEEATYRTVARKLQGARRAVIPGFYGADKAGNVVCFPRGGSDISGAVVARALGADLYENWTDVSGFLACDPKIVENPKKIETLSFEELRALSYMGASVLHIETLFPLRKAGIPIKILNTFRPEDAGTTIVKNKKAAAGTIAGLAGKKGYTAIRVEKMLLSDKIGAARRVLKILEENNVPLCHMPSGIDVLLFLTESKDLCGGKLERIVRAIEKALSPETINVTQGIALIAAVGGMQGSVGVAVRIFKAVARTGVNVRLIDQGSQSDLLFGVDEGDFERTLRAVYEEFFK